MLQAHYPLHLPAFCSGPCLLRLSPPTASLPFSSPEDPSEAEAWELQRSPPAKRGAGRRMPQEGPSPFCIPLFSGLPGLSRSRSSVCLTPWCPRGSLRKQQATRSLFAAETGEGSQLGCGALMEQAEAQGDGCNPTLAPLSWKETRAARIRWWLCRSFAFPDTAGKAAPP